MINEFAYSHPFFFIGAILVHVLTPKMFPVMLIYIYSSLMGLQVLSMLKHSELFAKIIYAVQCMTLFLLYIVIMSDDFCRFFLYRGHA